MKYGEGEGDGGWGGGAGESGKPNFFLCYKGGGRGGSKKEHWIREVFKFPKATEQDTPYRIKIFLFL